MVMTHNPFRIFIVDPPFESDSILTPLAPSEDEKILEERR
jgi:hypothetical protein